jgi:asparagine synthase (glutamine-hydrolysing)
MPGIVGLIGKLPRTGAEEQLTRMVDTIRHEAFYKTGTRIDESLGVYVGWAVQEHSFSDGTPYCNEKGDIALVFSGEEYPEPGTTRRLKERGHAFDTQTASYLVHLYEEDQAFPVGLNGMFHGLAIDRARGTVTLFNDRYGMHPIYYHESEDAFYFATEAKAILAVRGELRTADPKSLGEFVSFSCVLENRTIFKGIHVLPGASAWMFRNGTVEKKSTYFQPREWEEQSALDPESYYQELRGIFVQNLPRYFGGQERVGMTLTGGLDTRVIMASGKYPPKSLPCYTFGGMMRDCQDVVIARRVASVCQQSHSVIEVGAEFLSQFPQYAERTVYLTEGSVDVYRAADLYLSQRAREIAPAKVVGTYGSEIVRQAVMFKPKALLSGLFRSELASYVREAQETYANIRRNHPVTFAAFRQSPWYHHGILGLEQTQLTVRSPFMDNDFVRTVFRAPKPSNPEDDVRLRLIADGNPALARIRSDRGVGRASGRLSSAAARGFLEFTFKAEYAYDYGMPQWVAQVDHRLSALHLERLFLGRHKLLHFRVWYRNSLAKYLQQILLDPVALSRPYLERNGLETIVHRHIKGDRNYTSEIHKLLTLELFHRLFLDPR